jgi:hypothetical protein
MDSALSSNPLFCDRFDKNKRLGHALTVVKAQQDIKHQPKVRTNSEKLGYQKRGRQLYGPDYKPKIVAPPAVEMTV